MNNSSLSRNFARFALPLLTLAACTEQPTTGTTAAAKAPPRVLVAGPISDVPSVVMDLPPSPRTYDTSDSALDSAVLREDGNAIVAFKPELSPRAAAAGGRRAALSASAFQLGIELVQQSGGEIVSVYRSIGAAWVRVPEGVASQLRRSPLVDYVEPQQHWRVSGVRAPRLALKRMTALASDLR